MLETDQESQKPSEQESKNSTQSEVKLKQQQPQSKTIPVKHREEIKERKLTTEHPQDIKQKPVSDTPLTQFNVAALDIRDYINQEWASGPLADVFSRSRTEMRPPVSLSAPLEQAEAKFKATLLPIFTTLISASLLAVEYLKRPEVSIVGKSKKNIRDEIISSSKWVLYNVQGFSLHLERCLQDIVLLEEKNCSLYKKLQADFLSIIKQCLDFLKQQDVYAVDEIIYYSPDINDAVMMRNDDKNELGKPIDFKVSTLIQQSEKTLEQLNQIDKINTVLELRLQLFREVRSLAYVFNFVEKSKKINELIGRANSQKDPFLVPSLILLQIDTYLTYSKDMEKLGAPVAFEDLCEFIESIKAHGCDEGFFALLAETWLKAKESCPFYKNFDIYSSITQLAMQTQHLIWFLIRQLGEERASNEMQVKKLVENIEYLLNLQHSCLLFFRSESINKPQINGWCFLAEQNPIPYYFFLPALLWGEKKLKESRMPENWGYYYKTPNVTFSVKDILQQNVQISEMISATKLIFSRLNPIIFLGVILQKIMPANDAFYRLWFESQRKTMADKRTWLMDDKSRQYLAADDSEIKADARQKTRDEKKVHRNYSNFLSSLPGPASPSPQNTNVAEDKNKKKKSKKKTQNLSQPEEVMDGKRTTRTIFVNQSFAVVKEEPLTEVEKEVRTLFNSAREAVTKIGNVTNENILAEIKKKIDPLVVYTGTNYDKDIRLKTFAYITDLYTLQANRFINNKMIAFGAEAIEHADINYRQARDLLLTTTGEVEQYKRIISWTYEINEKLIDSLDRTIAKLEEQQNALWKRADDIKEAKGILWWETQLLKKAKEIEQSTGVRFTIEELESEESKKCKEIDEQMGVYLDFFEKIRSDWLDFIEDLAAGREVKASNEYKTHTTDEMQPSLSSSTFSSSSLSSSSSSSNSSSRFSSSSSSSSASFSQASSRSFSFHSFMPPPKKIPEKKSIKEKLFADFCSIASQFKWELLEDTHSQTCSVALSLETEEASAMRQKLKEIVGIAGKEGTHFAYGQDYPVKGQSTLYINDINQSSLAAFASHQAEFKALGSKGLQPKAS